MHANSKNFTRFESFVYFVYLFMILRVKHTPNNIFGVCLLFSPSFDILDKFVADWFC